MASKLLAIADAVVSTINGASLGQPLNAERLFLPQFELQEMNVLRVVVVPKDEERKPITRTAKQATYRVDVGVLKKVASTDAAEIDPLCALAANVAALFDGKRLAALPEAVCTVAKTEPVYSVEHLEQLRQFTSVIVLTFKLVE
jgi:hypothetical protein